MSPVNKPEVTYKVTGQKHHEDPDVEAMKLAVNNLIWTWGRPSLTLEEAEAMALEFMDRLTRPTKLEGKA